LDGDQYVQKAIYPYALITYNGKFSAVSLLQEQAPGMDEEQTLNKSIELLEYKFANIIQKLMNDERKNIVFLSGQGELPVKNTIRMERYLRQYYNTGRINLDSVSILQEGIDLLIVASPKGTYSDRDKFKLDQYIMNGGKAIWLIDKMDVTLDSINKHKFYIPNAYEHDLDDLFFKYGIRIKPDFVLDLESTRIAQIVGQQGGEAQSTLVKWYYNVLAQSDNNHPIVKNLERGVSASMNETLKEINQEFKAVSEPTKQIFISDSDFAKNLVNYRSNSAEPIGFDLWEQQVYPGNKEFIFNAIEYMLDENGILDSRSKEIKIRLLDAVKTKQEKSYWQFFNIVLPLLLLGVFGLIFNYIRRRRYGHIAD